MTSPIQAIFIVAGSECCMAAKALSGRCRSPETVPRSLPLPGCTMRDGCKCRFDVHAQQLDESAWRKVVDDMRHDRPARTQPALPRNPVSRAPRSVAIASVPTSRLVAGISPAVASLLAIALVAWLVYAIQR